MQIEILDYLNAQKVGVLAVELLDGSPHGATVHFAHADEPFVLFFETSSQSRKAGRLIAEGSARASFVVGSDETRPTTFQLDGNVYLLSAEEEKQAFKDAYLKKFPEKTEKITGLNIIFLKFVPSWWRFTDFSRPEGKLVLVSE
ncbi:MAG TPA: pyridoxamine 5'-phosphate oxidase family protein [Candidatus Paceibacterota bacterium]|nr:pyridoxamine 5'-phosphate oxidase family protein [Candidatus Paceibacterota bacterium]